MAMSKVLEEIEGRIKANQEKLDRCDFHEFIPEYHEQNAMNFYCVCKKCGGRVLDEFARGYKNGLDHGGAR